MQVSTTTTTKITLTASEVKQAIVSMLAEKGHNIKEDDLSFHITDLDGFLGDRGDDAITVEAVTKIKI